MNNSNKQPIVSVIIPAYNQGPMLASAIESALAQTYPHIEIIVVNDGSSDPITRSTAQAYEGRIRYIERENGGVAAARNTGIAASTGELIAWLDQDDRWLPHKLQVEVAALQAHPNVALVHSSYYYIDGAGKRTGVVRLREGVWYALPELLVEGTICTSSSLATRYILARVGEMDPTLAGSDDWDLWLHISALGYRFLCVGEPLVEYRTHENNTSNDIDLMITTSFRTLDKFYALPDLPAIAVKHRRQAYFYKHAAATALFYGAGRLDEAGAHLQKATNYFPRGVATGRFLQSLIYSKSTQPSWDTVEHALDFATKSLEDVILSPRIHRRLEAQKWLVRALHAGKSHRGRQVRYIGRALAADPTIVMDRELWRSSRRLVSKATAIFSRKATRLNKTLRVTLK